MEAIVSTSTIAEEIQLSFAPVFLLAAIGGLLNVLGAHLSRAVDNLKTDCFNQQERARGLRRITYIIWSSRLCVMTAIMICSVVVLIFLGDHVEPDLTQVISFSFIGAMILLTASLLLFLMQITAASERAILLAHLATDQEEAASLAKTNASEN